jgi:hypothetical protein
MELYADDCGLHEYQNENGMVGIMIGIDHPTLSKLVDFPGGEIVLASVQVLTPSELKYVVEYRAEGRNELHRRFKYSELYHFLVQCRASLVEAKYEAGIAIPSNSQGTEAIPSKKPWWKFW